MHTLKVIAGGRLLLALCMLGGRWLGSAGHAAMAAGARYFIPMWIGLAALNLSIGMTRAGYSVAEEAPIFVVIFTVPAAVAALLWWWLSRA